MQGTRIVTQPELSQPDRAPSTDPDRPYPYGNVPETVQSYGIAPGIIYSYPCRCKNGDYEIVQGLEIDAFSREKMDATDRELREERAAVENLLK